jgi:ABC-type transport system substrate-binding protein
MHGVTLISKDGNMFKISVFPSESISKAYIDMIAEDFAKIGYQVKLQYRDNKFVVNISDEVYLIGE